MINIAINGFGRIGRNVLRYIFENKEANISCRVIYDLYSPKVLAHLFEYDSVLGRFQGEVSYDENHLLINKTKVQVLKTTRQNEIFKWNQFDIDFVIDSSGQFRSREKASLHLKQGAKKVIITAPAINEDISIVMGVNHEDYDPDKHHIISNLSCTTNCLAPILWIIHKEFTFKRGFMNTVHSYTNDQEILDHAHSDLRRSRAAALSMIPTTTGATQAIFKLFPSFEGSLKGSSVRVPTPNVSLIDFVFETARPMSSLSLNEAFKKYSETRFKDILEYNEKPLVSIDYKKNSHSAIIDALSTEVISYAQSEESSSEEGLANMGRVMAWYDNEWAYSSRIIDLIKYINFKR